MNFTEF